METLKRFTPYIFSVASTRLRIYILLSIFALFVSKGASVYAPVLLKQLVNQIDSNLSLSLTFVGFLVCTYGLIRFANTLFEQLRDMLFSRVGQHAIRCLSLDVYKHLHNLPMSFHEDRNSGLIIKALDRGIIASEFIFKYIFYNIVPAVLEIVMIFFVLWTVLNITYAFIMLGTVISYVAFTIVAAAKRDKLLMKVNYYEDQITERAFDSLINRA